MTSATNKTVEPLVDRLRMWIRHFAQGTGVHNVTTRQCIMADIREAVSELERRPHAHSDRRPPRPINERTIPDVIRCGMCDWQVINGEGVVRTRPCCVEGLIFDIEHGLSFIGDTWKPHHD